MKDLHEVVIVGGGPAGLSAALLLGRCLREVLVIDAGQPRNRASKAMHGYLGLDGMNPMEFLVQARRQIAKYDTVSFLAGEVRNVEREGKNFVVRTSAGRVFRSRALLLATGVGDELPAVPGAERFYGISLHHCPYCDAWEHRGQRLGVLGHERAAVDLAVELRQWSREVTLYTNTADGLDSGLRKCAGEHGIMVVEGSVAELSGEGARLEAVVVGGRRHACEALFFWPRQRCRSDLASSLGCEVDDKECAIPCSPGGATQIAGLFAAGNVSPGMQMVTLATAEGVRAAAAINDWLTGS